MEFVFDDVTRRKQSMFGGLKCGRRRRRASVLTEVEGSVLIPVFVFFLNFSLFFVLFSLFREDIFLKYNSLKMLKKHHVT